MSRAATLERPPGLLGIIAALQDLDRFREQHWEGSFAEYLDIVREEPDVTRNAWQRLHDCVVSFGTEHWTEYKKPIVRYRFFDDPYDNGKDAIFGIDVHLTAPLGASPADIARIGEANQSCPVLVLAAGSPGDGPEVKRAEGQGTRFVSGARA